ncbi:MAG: hypothetical protein HOC77_10630 [Chloroflexi bacterium]|jgi:hypothetical protein|nr:hypothetical protein [Chloroflexota bacterium]MBT4073931.1 hypothetical protein [Chloroflexota bacterium]MBT4515532.1 hypothetical protein [Chloroflexota bacterium]
MLELKKLVTLVGVVMVAGVLAACGPTEKADCDGLSRSNADDEEDYEQCLEDLALYESNQTATSVAARSATATFEAEIATERADYTATNVALEAEQLKTDPGDRQTLNRAGTISGAVSKETPTATTTAAPTAETLPTALVNPAPTPTSVPVAPTAAPTPVPTPEPMATQVPVDLSKLAWLTAKQAAELATAEAPGVVFEIAGHASRAAGMLGSGDSAGSELSPGIGYARDWSVTLQTDTETYFCTVGLGITSCNASNFHYGDGEVETVSQDSTEALARFNQENNADWQALMSNDDISILLDLHPDLTGAVGAEPGTPIARIWSATITVHNATDGPRSGSFHWNLDTDAIAWSVF